MVIPTFLKDNDTIGVTACSCGVLDKIADYEKSLEIFNSYKLQIKETDNVRSGGVVSSSAQKRALELQELIKDNNVNMIAIASGGDFLLDMIPIVDFNLIKSNPKWIGGSSDPTSLLYIVTTRYDIATIYTPCNMSGFNIWPLHDAYKNYFKIIKGDLVKQYKFLYCEEKAFSDKLTLPNEWLNLNGNVCEEGILIGGCIECLKDIIGTTYDATQQFLEKYKDDGFIWYFDVFAMTSESLYNTLIQFKMAGWFTYTKAILIGKVAFANSFCQVSYEEMIKRALADLNIKIIYKFDVGHVKPSFTMINGMKARVISNDEESSLEYI